MSDAVTKFVKSYQGLIILTITMTIGFASGWFGNQYAVRDLLNRVVILEEKSNKSDTNYAAVNKDISSINQNMAGINAKLDLLLGGKIK